jgi:hypothetical protein
MKTNTLDLDGTLFVSADEALVAKLSVEREV